MFKVSHNNLLAWLGSGLVIECQPLFPSLKLSCDIFWFNLSFYGLYQKYNIEYIYNISQISKLNLTLCTFSVTGLVAGLFLII